MISYSAFWKNRRSLTAAALVTLIVSACGGSDENDRSTQTGGAGPSVGGNGDNSTGGRGGQTDSVGGVGGLANSEARGGAGAEAGSIAEAGAAGALTGQAGSGGDWSGFAGSGGSAGDGGDAGSGGEVELGPNDAVVYRIDRAHSGAQLAQRLDAPFERLWSTTFGATVSYPLIVGTRIFVTTTGQKGDPAVFAFDRDSGAPLWESAPIASEFHDPANLLYDAGLVIAANDEGRVLAVNAETGDTVWAVTLKDIYAFGTMPVAANGTVFLTGATNDYKNLFALDERDGSLRFRAKDDADGPVTLVGSRLFIAGGCHETFADDALDGQVLWHYREDCAGGGGEITVFQNGELFVADNGSAIIGLDASSGALTKSIGGKDFGYWPMAVVGNQALLPFTRARGGDLRAFDLTTGAEQWSVRLDEHPQLPTLVTPGYAFVVTQADSKDAYLQAVDLSKHQLVWTSAEPVAKWSNVIASGGSAPLQGLAAGQGRIVVAFQRTLTVLTSALKH
ncbi:MAG TPA: PQQ-binding-like beta-propeller repeat protein [Polyangiaceae bacterium]|nr:PQQ-binding-like beta-propeller repeat protein [Polyangiaceae bacterium]